ncbi:MAG: o-succinylbenzoate synthase [Thermoleophilia bacterium]
MLVERIDLYHVAMPLLYPWRTASHEEWAIHSVLVRLESGGAVGWGETTPFADPTFSPEWASGALAVLRDWLGPAVLGQAVDSGEALQALLRPFKGNPFAKAGLDLAWWDLQGKLTGTPLHELVGGGRDRIEVGADFGVQDSLDDLVRLVGAAVDEGFRRVKLKFRPGWDLEMVRAVRSTFPELACHVDCNSGYTLADLDLFQQVDRLGLVMIEQPLAHDDLVDHAALARALETPICLDETIVSDDRARWAIELGSCGWINLKHGRLGGLTVARRVHDRCREAGIRCWVGSMLESAVGSAFSVALATLDNVHYPADVFPTDRHYAQDLAAPEVAFERGPHGGRFALADPAPGIAPAPDEERLEAQAVERASLAAA